jgi:hypothetical protein
MAKMSIIRKSVAWLKQNGRIPRLTIKGLTNSTANSQKQKFDWWDALKDAVIISGLTFFSTLGGGSVAGLGVVVGLKVAAIAACAQFFAFLALKRGIVQSMQGQ